MQEIVAQLWPRVAQMLTSKRRVMIAVCGAPGAGKSTLVSYIAAQAAVESISCAVVPMDGFHLSRSILQERGWLQEKGSMRTFDADGYLALLTRIREQRENSIFAPQYIRGHVEESQASAIEIQPNARLVLTEGNYLLVQEEPWIGIANIADETWYVELEDGARQSRLRARHIANGKSEEQADWFTYRSDEANAQVVAATKHHADVLINQVASSVTIPARRLVGAEEPHNIAAEPNNMEERS